MNDLLKRLWFGFRRLIGGPYFPTAHHALLRGRGKQKIAEIEKKGSPLTLSANSTQTISGGFITTVNITPANQQTKVEHIIFKECVIGVCSVTISGRMTFSKCYIQEIQLNSQVAIDLFDCYVEKIVLQGGAVGLLDMDGCMVDEIVINRIAGNVVLNNVRFARSFELPDAIQLPQHYRSFVHELRNRRNTDAAYVVQAAELSIEESFKKFSFGKLFVRGYEYVSDFGQLLLRPLVLIVIAFVSAWWIAWEGGTSPRLFDASDLPGWKGIVANDPVWRASYVAARTVFFFPVGVMIREELAVVNNLWQVGALAIVSTITVGLWAAVIVAVRRRLRMEP